MRTPQSLVQSHIISLLFKASVERERVNQATLHHFSKLPWGSFTERIDAASSFFSAYSTNRILKKQLAKTLKARSGSLRSVSETWVCLHDQPMQNPAAHYNPKRKHSVLWRPAEYLEFRAASLNSDGYTKRHYQKIDLSKNDGRIKTWNVLVMSSRSWCTASLASHWHRRVLQIRPETAGSRLEN